MKIKNIDLHHYRNHLKKNVEFEDTVTVIFGPNGSGKTNILEAIYLLATGRSAKSRYDKDLINHESTFCSIQAKVATVREDLDLEIQVIANENGNNIAIKRTKVNQVSRTLQHLIGLFNAVLFTPQDIDLVIGSPNDRRKFIDNILIQTDISYKKQLSDYNKALRQRNKLLEMINETNTGQDQLNFWTEKILSYGQNIQQKRQTLLTCLNQQCFEYIHILDGPESNLEILYKKNEINQERLEKHKYNEIAAKTTLVGPHRDDFEMRFNEYNLADFGSRGQQRTVVLSIKLAEVDYFETQTNERPVLLLDDIFSELDEHHRIKVLETINKQQTIITLAEEPEGLGLSNKTILTLYLPTS